MCALCSVLKALSRQWRSQPKILGDQKIWGCGDFFILGEKQHLVWDTASQSTKWLDILKIWGCMSPGYAKQAGSKLADRFAFPQQKCDIDVK